MLNIKTKMKFKDKQLCSISKSKKWSWSWQVHHYFKIFSLEVLSSKSQELAMAVKDTFGSGMGPLNG